MNDALQVGAAAVAQSVQVAQSFDPDQFGKVLSYSHKDIPTQIAVEVQENLEALLPEARERPLLSDTPPGSGQ